MHQYINFHANGVSENEKIRKNLLDECNWVPHAPPPALCSVIGVDNSLE